MNGMAYLEFEHIFYDNAVQFISNYTTGCCRIYATILNLNNLLLFYITWIKYE